MYIDKRGVTFPIGFKANGEHVGLKKVNKDMSIIYSEKQATYAGFFTTNQVKAAPVLFNQQRFKEHSKIHGILVNSGQANACTGKQGDEDCMALAKACAKELGCTYEEVLVASTGVIGVHIPMEKAIPGVEKVVLGLEQGEKADAKAARGILTTDTCIKQKALEIVLSGGKKVRIGGMAKGSGMIHPNMATMLSFITTDAKVSQTTLYTMMDEIVKETYNMISVDGDTSTNDMVLALANGASGCEIKPFTKDYETFKEALKSLNTKLAKSIVGDGEGAGKLVEVKVSEANTSSEAKAIAKAITTSNLVKTALFGEDPNWGRILCAVGYAGVDIDTTGVSIAMGNPVSSTTVFQHGKPYEYEENDLRELLKSEELSIKVKLGSGEESATAWGCDLSYDYVRINGEYRS